MVATSAGRFFCINFTPVPDVDSECSAPRALIQLCLCSSFMLFQIIHAKGLAGSFAIRHAAEFRAADLRWALATKVQDKHAENLCYIYYCQAHNWNPPMSIRL